jgi:hypothetical protein
MILLSKRIAVESRMLRSSRHLTCSIARPKRL